MCYFNYRLAVSQWYDYKIWILPLATDIKSLFPIEGDNCLIQIIFIDFNVSELHVENFIIVYSD